jgi:hypothetical protein
MIDFTEIGLQLFRGVNSNLTELGLPFYSGVNYRRY